MERLTCQLRASARFLDDVADPPVVGSAMHAAFAEDSRDEYDHARLAMRAAEDHLHTIVWIVEARKLPAFALYTLLRGAAETLARACHLMNGPTVTERRTRALNVRLQNLVEQEKVLKPRPRKGKAKPQTPTQVARDQEATRLFRRQCQHLERRAAGFGIDVRRDSKGGLAGFGSAPLPPLWELIAEVMDEGELSYRVMSGFGHGMQWALLRKERSQPSPDPNVVLFATELDLAWFLPILNRVVDLHDRAVGRWCSMAGQPTEVWQLAKQGE
jgi:hypothetical protein